MVKIIYLHGLESSQGGKKVDFLAKNNSVYAPMLDYNNDNEFIRIKNEIEIIKPDIIIGSSMGGYFAYLFGSLFSTSVILFNPAIHSRSTEINNTIRGKFPVKGLVILGEHDSIINPNTSIQMLKSQTNLQIKVITGMKHRTPLEIFKNEVTSFLNLTHNLS